VSSLRPAGEGLVLGDELRSGYARDTVTVNRAINRSRKGEQIFSFRIAGLFSCGFSWQDAGSICEIKGEYANALFYSHHLN
jgi:hypothetical protein